MTHDWEAEHANRDSWGVWPAEYMVRALAAYTGPRDFGLDIGTGGGAHLRLLRESGFKISFGQDISKTAIDRVQARFATGCVLRTGNINDMEFQNQFNVIIDNLSLTHVENPDWDRIWSWLAIGGRFISAQFLTQPKNAPPSWAHMDRPTVMNDIRTELLYESIGHDNQTMEFDRVCAIRVITWEKTK